MAVAYTDTPSVKKQTTAPKTEKVEETKTVKTSTKKGEKSQK